jgi:NAD(P)-dependent dehydrogenase (short-subunit alcohol dehydrogenase family)
MSDPVCAVVGYGPGVGHGVARAFAAEGYDLALLSRAPERHAALRAELEPHAIRIQPFAVDAGDAAALRAALQRVALSLGEISVLIYNAVAPTYGRPTALTPEQLVADFRVNVAGALAAVHTVLPAMRARGAGSILFTGGGSALAPWVDGASIGIGKAALRNLTYTLAEDLKATGIHIATVTVCGAVQPGTPFNPERIGQAFVSLHRQSPAHFETELQLR